MCHALTVAKLCFDTAARLQARVTRGERFILFSGLRRQFLVTCLFTSLSLSEAFFYG